MLNPALKTAVVLFALLAPAALAEDGPTPGGAPEVAPVPPAEAPPRIVDEALDDAVDDAADDALGEADRIVVTATRTEQKVEDVASSVTVVTESDIEETQAKTACDALRNVPGLSVVQTGPVGGIVSVFMRGAKSQHTLVMVDGIEVSDPMSPGRGVNPANVTVDNIDRIEVIRGPQSTLYGSDAIGGVINIITKKGTGKPSHFVSFEGGSYNTFKGVAGSSGKAGITSYSFTASAFGTGGISAIEEAAVTDPEKDGYTNTTVSARLDFDPSESFGGGFVVRYVAGLADVDDDFAMAPEPKDDPNYTVEAAQLFVAGTLRFAAPDGSLKSNVRISLNDMKRDHVNEVDADHPTTSSTNEYTGQILKGEYQGDLGLGESNLLTFGVEVEQENGWNRYTSGAAPPTVFEKKFATTTSVFIQDQIEPAENLNATLGLRLDSHDEFGSAVTYRATAGYRIDSSATKVKATFGTGFKAPSLYQLYDSWFGNPGLEAEESVSFDVGVEQEFGDGIGKVSVTYFNNDFKKLIDLDAVWVYQNIDRAEAEGIEVLASAKLGGKLSINASYTNTQTEDRATGEVLARRPEHKYALDVRYRFAPKGTVSLGASYVSDRLDRKGGSIVEQYALVNLAAHYEIDENLAVFGRIDNLFDEEYEEAKGYGTPGFSFYVGAKATF